MESIVESVGGRQQLLVRRLQSQSQETTEIYGRLQPGLPKQGCSKQNAMRQMWESRTQQGAVQFGGKLPVPSLLPLWTCGPDGTWHRMSGIEGKSHSRGGEQQLSVEAPVAIQLISLGCVAAPPILAPLDARLRRPGIVL